MIVLKFYVVFSVQFSDSVPYLSCGTLNSSIPYHTPIYLIYFYVYVYVCCLHWRINVFIAYNRDNIISLCTKCRYLTRIETDARSAYSLSHKTKKINGKREGNLLRQEAQLMLTNPRDAFRGQSKPPNMVPFHMLSMVSY